LGNHPRRHISFLPASHQGGLGAAVDAHDKKRASGSDRCIEGSVGDNDQDVFGRGREQKSRKGRDDGSSHDAAGDLSQFFIGDSASISATKLGNFINFIHNHIIEHQKKIHSPGSPAIPRALNSKLEV
jgi:hypothetical protein